MARTGRPVIEITLGAADKDFLRKLSATRTAPTAEVKRERSILLIDQGISNQDIARRVGFCAATVGTLRGRFHQLRLEGLSDLPRSGPTRKLGDDQIEILIEKTLHSKPKGATHWSTRKNGREDGHFSR